MTFGLSNFGSPLESNICFINAILQLLHSLALIRNLVKKKGYKANPDSVTPVLDEISRIFKYEGPVTSAGPLRQLLGAKEGLEYVMSGEQEDASRFLQHLLEQTLKEIDPTIELEKMITMSVTHSAALTLPMAHAPTAVTLFRRVMTVGMFSCCLSQLNAILYRTCLRITLKIEPLN